MAPESRYRGSWSTSRRTYWWGILILSSNNQYYSSYYLEGVNVEEKTEAVVVDDATQQAREAEMKSISQQNEENKEASQREPKNVNAENEGISL